MIEPNVCSATQKGCFKIFRVSVVGSFREKFGAANQGAKMAQAAYQGTEIGERPVTERVDRD